jgi:hypothetical protein
MWRVLMFRFIQILNRINSLLFRNRQVLYIHAFGLGDMIFSATLLERLSENFSKVYVPCQEKYLVNLELLFEYLDNVYFVPLDMKTDERSALLAIRKNYKLPVISCARRSIFVTRYMYPNLGLNTIYNKATGFKIENLVSFKLARHLDKKVNLAKLASPAGRYAFIDHAKDTPREISENFLENLRERKMDLIFNDHGVSLLQIYQTMKGAAELHLMGSSLLCLAIVTNINTNMNVYYRPEGAWDLLSDEPNGVWKTQPNGRTLLQ